jgi:RHS repeat-associated protein
MYSRLNRRIFLFGVFLAAAAFGDQHPNLERGFDAASAYEIGELDQVNLFNGNLSLTLPIGQTYQGSGNLRYGFTLVYNSKVWDWDVASPGDFRRATAGAHNNAGLGWRFSLGELFAPDTPFFNSARAWVYMGPDGAEHLFFKSLKGTAETCSPGVCYTRDGSYLRLKNGSGETRVVEMPDGNRHTFEPWGNPIRYRLTEIRDVYGNRLEIDYGTADQWNLKEWDAAGVQVRTHQMLLTTLGGFDWLANHQMVLEARLAAFGGAQAVYKFDYLSYSIPRPLLHENGTGLPNPVALPFLVDITLPDLSHYKMPGASGYLLDPPQGNRDVPGILSRLNLPTGGRIEWSFGRWSFPTGESYNPQQPPRNQPDFVTHSSGITARRLYDLTGTLLGAWSYASHLDDPAGVQQLPIQKRTEVVDPSGNRTVHYFSVDQGGSLLPTPDSNVAYYGLPFTVLVNDGTTRKRFLSREVFASGETTPSRRFWLAYDYEAGNETDSSGTPSRRPASERVDYVADDTHRIVDRTDFDGLGHFRRTVTGGNFPFSGSREEFINWNPPAGSWPDGFTLPSANGPWILETFTEQRQSEGGEAARQEACFEASTGFLLRERIRRLDDLQDSRDVLRVYARDGLGNRINEKLYGADLPGQLAAGALCGLALPANATFHTEHVFEHGSLKSSRYAGAPYYLVQNEIDANTGLAKRTFDISGIGVSSTFDTLGRLTAITPDAGHDGRIQIVYTPVGTTRASVNVYRYDGGTTLLAEEQFRYDGLGRLWREYRKSAGAAAWSIRQTLFSPQGWMTEQTEWALDPLATGVGKTLHSQHDPFGRPALSTLPDGKQIKYFYDGERRVAKQFSVGFERDPQNGAIREHLAGTSEEFDLHGRLVRVEQGSIDNDPQDLFAEYDYTVEGKMSRACLRPRGGGGPQCRTFDWDRRGFLLSEYQPESGTWSYGLYDAAGNFTRKTHASGLRDLTFEYDSYARPIRVWNELTDAKVQEWTYASSNGPGGNQRLGKIETAKRLNLIRIPWNQNTYATVEVKETYVYAGRNGRASSRKTEALGRTFEQSWSWDPLGNTSTLNYPRCVFAGCSGVAASRALSFQYSQDVLAGISGWASLVYHPNGMLAKVNHQNGVEDSYDLDPAAMQRPANVRVKLPGQVENQLGRHLYDGMGNLVKRQIETGSRSFDELAPSEPRQLAPAAITDEFYLYDDFGRLIRYNERGGSAQSYTYDPYSNLTSIEHFDGLNSVTRGYAVSPATNRLSSGYGYNDFGELEVRPMGSGSEKFTYDILGAVTSRNFPSETYLYTADGERIYTLYYQPGIPNREEWLLRDLGGGALTLYEKNDLVGGGETWSWKKDYIYRDDFLLGVATSDAAANRKEQHFTLDHLGNPRLTTDKFGSSTPIAVRHFYGYGEEYGPAVQDGEKLRYTAHERAVGAAGAADDLDYMHARYRSPFLGRFSTPDPIASADPKSPHTWNRYTYAGGNPLHYVDPDGRAVVARNRFTSQRSLEFNGMVRDELASNLKNSLPFGGGLLAFAVDAVAGSLFSRNDQELAMNSMPMPAMSLTSSIGGKGLLPNLSATTTQEFFESAAASAGKGGVTGVGRALQKHSSRAGSWVEGLASGDAKKNTDLGLKLMKEIFSNGQVSIKNHKAHGVVISVRRADGAGFWFTASGKLIGILERHAPK